LRIMDEGLVMSMICIPV